MSKPNLNVLILAAGANVAEVPAGGHPYPVCVTEIDGNQATLDGNHPLAGQALIFNCTVAAIRPASADEIANGSVDSDA